ncbi:Alpha-1 3-glucosyltransferase [Fasciola hepatica]|uniref:Alpha-1,3-glucosyltransferase n=1 Tax=Fasciola hepatica TaxID=6192 RepID=A0A2H1CVG1_FASHE|nr:Alpha-1 3-glucosyltransferase [Fasciola hepatica]
MKSDDFLRLSLPVLLSLTLRSSVLLHPHSGQGKPPMYGDYEAQRHWMEITTNLPPSEWYFNSTKNDLNYWGLDYPPLTAYHSWVLGKISHEINPAWTSLTSSRGVETKDHKLFMRYTVLLADLLVFIPAVLYFFYVALPTVAPSSEVPPFYACCLTFMYPGLILIDHGHFQYNCVSLGLFILALGLILRNRDISGTVFFCLALSYKQMELYHSLPLFFYLLGKCVHSPASLGMIRLLKLSAAVLSTLALVFTPFLTNTTTLYQVFHRLFPVARGLYEDKVANFWCATSPLLKWPVLFAQMDLVKLCIASVALLSFPGCLSLLVRPSRRRLLYTLSSTSMAFFLFSYQVHEKSILLVAIPALCTLPICPLPSFLFALSSTLSMWPLFLKDQLVVPCLCTTLIFVSMGSIVLMRSPSSTEANSSPASVYSLTLLFMILSSYGVIFFSQALWYPPAAYPDLFALLISALSCFQFVVFLLFWNYKSFAMNGKSAQIPCDKYCF